MSWQTRCWSDDSGQEPPGFTIRCHVARARRHIQSNVVYHIFNRRTDKQCLFANLVAYDRFLDIVAKGRKKYPVRHHAFCLMKTHWHLAISSELPGAIPLYLRWLATTHAVGFRWQTNTRGNGHVYQDRYKAVPVDGLLHYSTLVRYIEANALNAGLVSRAEDWPWSSLKERLSGRNRLIEPGPWALPEPKTWTGIVNAPNLSLALEPFFLNQVATFGPPVQMFQRADTDGAG